MTYLMSSYIFSYPVKLIIRDGKWGLVPESIESRGGRGGGWLIIWRPWLQYKKLSKYNFQLILPSKIKGYILPILCTFVDNNDDCIVDCDWRLWSPFFSMGICIRIIDWNLSNGIVRSDLCMSLEGMKRKVWDTF